MPEEKFDKLKVDFWSMYNKSGNLTIMCENSGLFADVISCAVFREHEPIGTISFSFDEIKVFDNSGRMKEVLMYGGGKVSLR